MFKVWFIFIHRKLDFFWNEECNIKYSSGHVSQIVGGVADLRSGFMGIIRIRFLNNGKMTCTILET